MRERLQADVEALAAQSRGSATPGERAAAEWAAGRLRASGAVDVAVEPARGSGTYAWAFAAYAAVALLAARGSGARRAALAACALAAFELDASGRWAPLRRALPRGEGANATARVPAGGAGTAAPAGGDAHPASHARCVAVLVAHLDTARTGLIWRTGLTKLGTRPGRMPPGGGLAGLAFVLAAGGAALGCGPGRIPRALAQGLLGATVAANVGVATSPSVPGANDNASGVAGVLELVRGVAADPLPGLEVRVALVGSEESGMDGMRAWLAAHGPDLDPRRTLVLGLDTIGSGTPIAASGEGVLATHRYGAAELALADTGAQRAGLPAPPRWRIGGWTDPILARFAGLPALSLLSVDASGGYTNYHRPSDVPAGVDYDCVERSVRIARGTLEAFAAGGWRAGATR